MDNIEIINYENDLLKDLNYNNKSIENNENNITVNINDFYENNNNTYNLNNGIDHIIKEIYLEININDYNELVNSESKDLLYLFLDTELYINECDNQILTSTILSSIYIEIINTSKDVIIIDNKVKIYLYNNYYNKLIITKDSECTLSIDYYCYAAHLFENIYIVYNIINNINSEETNNIIYITSDHITNFDIEKSKDNKIILKNASLDICSIIGLDNYTYINDVDIYDTDNTLLNSITEIITIMDNDFYLITYIEDINNYINNVINPTKDSIKNNKNYKTNFILTIDNKQHIFMHNIYIVN